MNTIPAYLIIGTPGSGRRGVIWDVIQKALGDDDFCGVFISENEAPAQSDKRIASAQNAGIIRYRDADDAIEKIAALDKEKFSQIFFFADASRNLADDIEDFKRIVDAGDARLARIWGVLDCGLLAARREDVQPYADALSHFSDCLLLSRREGLQNREVAVVIHSAEVADYFAGAFLNDFDTCYNYDGLRVDITEIQDTYEAGKEVTFTVDVVNGSGNYTYFWDFGDGTEVRETDEPRVCHTPVWNGEDAAVYNLTVRVVDQDNEVEGEAHATYVILKEGVQWGDQDQPSDGDQDQSEGNGIPSFLSEYMYILAPLLVIILAIVGALSRSRKKSKRK